jgi:hypothetical protein
MKILRKINAVHMFATYLLLVFGFASFGMTGTAIVTLLFFPFVWLVSAVIVEPKK